MARLRPRAIGRRTLFRAACTILLLAGAAWLRLTAMTYDRPFEYHPDEWLIVEPALHIAASHDPNPHTFLYPTLLTYTETAVVEIVHRVTGAPLTVPPAPNHGGLAAYSAAEVDPSQYVFVEWGRAVVGFLGVMTALVVLLAGLAAKRRVTPIESQGSAERPSAAHGEQLAAAHGEPLVPGQPEPSAESRFGERAWLAGLAGAAFMAVAVLPVVNSRYLTTDVPSAFFCAAALAASLASISRSPDRTSDRMLILAGFMVGLAASSKYNAGVVAMVPALAYLTRAGSIRGIPGWLPGAVRSRTPYLVGLAAVVGFVVTTPMIIFDTGAVVSAIQYQITVYNVEGHVGAQGDSLRYYVDYLWTTGFGPVLSVLAVAGIGWALLRHQAADLLLVGFALVYFALVSIPFVHFERNLLPLVPFVALMAGRFVADAALALRDLVARRSSRLASALVATLLALLLVQPAMAAVADGRTRGLPDTRATTLAWVDEHLPAGSAVVREAYTPQLSADLYRPGWVWTLSDHDLSWYRSHGFRYAVASSYMYDRYVAAGGAAGAFYASLFAQPTLYRLSPSDDLSGPTIVILDLGSGGATK